MFRCLTGIFVALMLCAMPVAQATPAVVWQQAMQMAAGGNTQQAIAHLSGASGVLSGNDEIWSERMQLAVILLDMRERQAVTAAALDSPVAAGWTEVRLVKQYQLTHSEPLQDSLLVPGILAALFPGAGHAWQGRWRDAGVAAMLVWPMLILTLWALRRRMGPVTVFFGLLTVWLWSGTVFSSVSLAERGSLEAYLTWWQGLWQASALPGRPW